MPFCHAPWTNLDISPEGAISPCCKFNTDYYTNGHFDIDSHSIDDYRKSDFLRQIKDEWNKGIWPKGCERCKIEEDNGIASKRQLDQERWALEYDRYELQPHIGFITASIAFGNTCNLKCLSCGPESSTGWHQEYKELTGKTARKVEFFKKDFVQNIRYNAKHLIHLDIPGGEPFLSGVQEQRTLLGLYIESGHSPDITLHYTTNATHFPSSLWWAAWSRFKQVEIQISIDGIDEQFEFLRYPAKWQQVYENIKKYQDVKLPNFKLSISHTVSALNVFYLPEFFDWCEAEGLPKPWCGRVQNPEWLRPTIWTEDQSQQIITKLNHSKHEDLKHWAKMLETTDDSKHFVSFQEYLKWHSNYRKLDYTKVFPELVNWINSEASYTSFT